MQSINYIARSQCRGQTQWLLRLASLKNQAHLVGSQRYKSDGETKSEADLRGYYYPNTDVGIKERSIKGEPIEPIQRPYPPFPGGKNPKTGEVGGPVGPEPTRFGDWERKGRVSDF